MLDSVVAYFAVFITMKALITLTSLFLQSLFVSATAPKPEMCAAVPVLPREFKLFGGTQNEYFGDGSFRFHISGEDVDGSHNLGLLAEDVWAKTETIKWMAAGHVTGEDPQTIAR